MDRPGTPFPMPPLAPQPPTHEGLKQWGALTAAIKGTGPFPVPAAHSRKQVDLFDAYIHDLRMLEDDLCRRPEHYTTEEHELVRRLRAREPATSVEKAQLVLSFMRSSPAAQATKAVLKKVTAPEDPEVQAAIHDPDGRHATFENQEDFGPTIIIV